MSKFSQEIKVILQDVCTFFASVKDTSLGSEAQAQKKHILAAIQKLYTEYPPMAPAIAIQSSSEPTECAYDDTNVSPVVAPKQRLVSVTTKTVTATSPAAVVSTDYQGPPHAGEVIPDMPAQSLTNQQKGGYLGKEKKKSAPRFTLGQTQKRYCIIQNGVFYYYEKAESRKQKGAFKLADYEAAPVIEEAKDGSQKPSMTAFQVTCPGKRSYTFKASDYDDMQSWIDEITKASSATAVAEEVYDDTGAAADEAIYDETMENPDSQAVYDDTSAPTPVKSPVTATVALPVPPTPKLLPTLPLPSTPTLPSPVMPAPTQPTAATAATEDDEEIYADVDEQAPLPSPAVAPFPATPTGPRHPTSRPLPPPPDAPAQETVSVRKDDYGNMYYGMWDCQASKDFELSFSSGEIIHVIGSKYEDRGWWTAVLNGKVGLVPKNYLTPAYMRV